MVSMGAVVARLLARTAGDSSNLTVNGLACEVACAHASNEATAGHGPSPAPERAFAESLW